MQNEWISLPKLAIFDVDGLLLNTEYIWLKAHQIIARKYGIPAYGNQLFQKAVGLSGDDFIRVFHKIIGYRNDEEQLRRETMDTGMKLLETELQVLPGVMELLDFLK